MNPDLRCYHHPERGATSQCDRCGDYLCSECVNEHDELHICARCLEDVTPREEIGKSAKIACVMNALACSYLWLEAPLGHLLTVSAIDALAVISMIVSLLASFLASSDMRGEASGEILFRWSVMTSASGYAIYVAVVLLVHNIDSLTELAIIQSVSLVIPLTSVALLIESVRKKAGPKWALIVALLAPLMFSASHLLFLVTISFRFLAKKGLV